LLLSNLNLISAIGRAKAIGRDRWYELKLLLDKPGNSDIALEVVASPDVKQLSSEERFNKVVAKLKSSRGPKSKKQPSAEKAWSLSDDSVKVSTKDTGRAFTLALKSRDASKFGAYLSDRLERLYQEFQENSRGGRRLNQRPSFGHLRKIGKEKGHRNRFRKPSLSVSS
jgi:ParB family chromosome partitioning protein